MSHQLSDYQRIAPDVKLAGSVVTKAVAANATVAGNPARLFERIAAENTK
jgi:serine acetyltransferase